MRGDTISMKLLGTLRAGSGRLSEEARRLVSGFVGSQRTEEGAFINKNGEPDIYYTLFGWMLSYALGIETDTGRCRQYLASAEATRMDLVHYAAYVRCGMLLRLQRYGKAGALAPVRILDTDRLEGYPNGDPRSPYAEYVKLSLMEDAGKRIEREKILGSLAGYRRSGGGYSNRADGEGATTNATAAALMVIGELSGYRNEEAAWLRSQQRESGGFGAAPDAPVPDMLSTATSLFALKCYDVKPWFPAEEFVQAHWLGSGGFSATLLDDKSDVEYTFYGLLALGAL